MSKLLVLKRASTGSIILMMLYERWLICNKMDEGVDESSSEGVDEFYQVMRWMKIGRRKEGEGR